jgi:molybdenum cofactor cytidylyltransferase
VGHGNAERCVHRSIVHSCRFVVPQHLLRQIALMSVALQTFAIVPAAGKSARMGTAKLLLPWQGRALIDHLLDAWQRSRVQRIVVVCREDDRALRDHLAGHNVELVLPSVAPPQMKDSVCAALVHVRDHYAPQKSDAWLLAPADLPQLSPCVIDQVLAAGQAAPGATIVPRAAGRRGHPVLFPWALHEAVLALGSDQGVNSLLDRGPLRYVETAEAGSWRDVDHPDDYHRLAQEKPPDAPPGR